MALCWRTILNNRYMLSSKDSWFSNCKAGPYGEWDEKNHPLSIKPLGISTANQFNRIQWYNTNLKWPNKRLKISSLKLSHKMQTTMAGFTNLLKKLHLLFNFSIFIFCATSYLKRQWQLIFWIVKSIYHSLCCHWFLSPQ